MTALTSFLVLSALAVQAGQPDQSASKHDDAAHLAGQCPNGPNGPNCPKKPKPAPAPAPPAPLKPDAKPIVPRLDLSLDDWLALGIGGALIAGAFAWRAKRDADGASR